MALCSHFAVTYFYEFHNLKENAVIIYFGEFLVSKKVLDQIKQVASNIYKERAEKVEISLLSTVLSPMSKHRCCKKNCPLITGERFLDSWVISVLFSKIYYFYTCIWGSQGNWKTSGSIGTKKRKKEIMLNCCNL